MSGRRPNQLLLVPAVAALLAAPGVASASTVGARSGFAVDGKGRTLYALSGETAKHLECTSSACLTIWRPLMRSPSKAALRTGSGVTGRLGVVRRPGGRSQVTLRGRPLYRFAGDAAPGEVNGDGLFDGTWRAVLAGGGTPAPLRAPAPSVSPFF